MNEGQFGVAATRVDVNLVDGHSGGSTNPDIEANRKKVPVALKSKSVLKSTSTRALDQPDDPVQPAANGEQQTTEKKAEADVPPVAEAQPTPAVETKRSKEAVDKERGFVRDFVADLLITQLGSLTEEQKILVNKLRNPSALSAEDRKKIEELVDTNKAALKFPPEEYFKTRIQKEGNPPSQADYVADQLKFLLAYYYGKEPKTEDAQMFYTETAKESKELEAAAECFGILTGSGDALAGFSLLAESFSEGVIDAGAFQRKLEEVKGMKELNNQRILSPQDLESVQKAFSGVFDEMFNNARTGAFPAGEGKLGALKNKLNLLKWTEFSIDKYKTQMKELQIEQQKCVEELQANLRTLQTLADASTATGAEPEEEKEKRAHSLITVQAEVARLNTRTRDLTVQIGALKSNITMLEEGRKGREQTELTLKKLLELYTGLPSAKEGKQKEWFNIYSFLMGNSPQGAEIQNTIAQTDEKYRKKLEGVKKDGASDEQFEKRSHLVMKMGLGLAGVIALMTIMQVVNGIQSETAHAG